MSRLRVLICGAGIAGNALAFWLSRLEQCDVTVVERFPELRTNGLQVDIRGHGITVIKRMDLEAAVRAKCVHELGIELVDTTGRQWAYLPANTSGKGAQLFTSEFEIMRGDLCQILYDNAKQGMVKYKFGTSVTNLRDVEGEPVRVQYADGTSEDYDLVVGADGQGSRTRKMMLGSGTPDTLVNLHQYIAYLTVPGESSEEEFRKATAFMPTDGRFILTRRSHKHKIQLYLTAKHIGKRLENVARDDVEAEKQAFANEFRGAGWVADELVDKMLKSDDFYCQRDGFVKQKPLNHGRVVLLGDAGYSGSVNGYGTTSALVGAYVLAGELAKQLQESRPLGQTVKDALNAYESRLRPFVDIIQHGLSEKSASEGTEFKPWQIRGIYWVLRITCAMKLYKLAGLFSDKGMKGWVLPEYPELKSA